MPIDLPIPTLVALTERLAIAGLIGLAVGIEREWSAPASGPERRFAGLRTFLLIGLLGGLAGALVATGYLLPATVLLAASGGFIVAAYVMAIRRPEQQLDGTTEAAALVVLGLSLLAGLGYLALAAGAVAVVVFALGEKVRLHRLVHAIDQAELRAAMQFLVLALVILPLLPPGPYEELWGFRPRSLWTIVLILSGVNFAGYIARRAIGPARGYVVTGLIGGTISSTAVTLQFARLSRSEPKQGAALALGVVGACTVLPLRVFLVTAALNLTVAWALVPYLLPAFAVGLIFILVGLRRPVHGKTPPPDGRSPLHLGAALQMAVAFQLSMLVLEYTSTRWGTGGLFGTAALLGLTDVDALTVSMARLTGAADLPALAARGIAIGIASNTLTKFTIAAVIGTSTFRRWTLLGLTALFVAIGIVLL